MLDQLTYQSPTTVVKQAISPRAVNGRGRPDIRKLSKSQRAALAVAVVRGEAGLEPTLVVVSRALDVSITYVEAASKLSAAQLRDMRQGRLTFADLKPAKAPAPVKAEVTIEDVAVWWWSASEADRAAVVDKVGVAPLWDAIAKQLV